MNTHSASLTSTIDQLLADYKRYMQYTTGVSREFVYTTFFEKLIKLLGWDPWVTDEYVPFRVNVSHELHYGARLFLPNKECILAVFLTDDQIYSPQELKLKNLDMSFPMREAFLTIEKLGYKDIKAVWFSSISKNFIYNYPDENPLYFFAGQPEEFGHINRQSILNHFFPNIRFRTTIETGMRLAFWLKEWEDRILKCKGIKEAYQVHNFLDFLVAVTLFGRSGLQKSEKNLLEHLLINYYLSKKQEFLLEVNFVQVLPKIFENYKLEYNFNFYDELTIVKNIPNSIIVKLLEEIVCHSSIVFSLESLGLAYHLLEHPEIFFEVKKRNILPDRITPIPVLSHHVDIRHRTARELQDLIIRVDGNDIGIVLGTYDRLEQNYTEVNLGLSSFMPRKQEETQSYDLFGQKETFVYTPTQIMNIPCQILEKNLKIVNSLPSRRRSLKILLVKKIISSLEKNQKSGIKFPRFVQYTT